MKARGFVMAVALSVVALSAQRGYARCDPTGADARCRPRTVADALRRVSLQQTTAEVIERTFGKADARTPDGALVYHFERDHGRAHETEAVTFRFSRGVLTKICRVRSAT